MPKQGHDVPVFRDEEFSPAPYVTAMRKQRLGAASPLQAEVNSLSNPPPFKTAAKLLHEIAKAD